METRRHTTRVGRRVDRRSRRGYRKRRAAGGPLSTDARGCFSCVTEGVRYPDQLRRGLLSDWMGHGARVCAVAVVPL